MSDSAAPPSPREVAYPPDLARWTLAHWPADAPMGIAFELFREALATAFQASMTSEEARPSRFRLLLMRPEALTPQGASSDGVLRLLFDRSRPLDVEELRRLAPSSPFETSLIGAHEENGALRIWGLAHSGPAWLSPTWGGRDPGPIWTTDPIIHVNGPGQIAVRRAGVLVGALEHGALVDTTIDVLQSAWLPAHFDAAREVIRTQHAAGREPRTAAHSLVGRISQNMLRRCIQLVRSAQHGGLVLLRDGTGSSAGLRLKYRFEPDASTHRYHAILLGLLDAVADATNASSIDWQSFVTSRSTELERLEKAVFEWSRVIANLAAIDGAVVLDKSFTVIGFGAEVSAELPAPTRVWRALDREGERRRPEDAEAVGTRHRAAYRFVNDHPDALAIVVSHDGAVTFVANQQGDVVVWEQATRP
jgi:hypothetical protein